MIERQPMDEQKKSVIWQEWMYGTSLADVVHSIDKTPATVFSYLRYHKHWITGHRFRGAQVPIESYTATCHGQWLSQNNSKPSRRPSITP